MKQIFSFLLLVGLLFTAGFAQAQDRGPGLSLDPSGNPIVDPPEFEPFDPNASPTFTPTPTADDIADDPYCRIYCPSHPEDRTCFMCNISSKAVEDENNEGVVNVGNPLGGYFGSSMAPRADTRDAISSVQTRLGQLLGNILRGIAALALLPIVVGGFQMILSQGSEDKVKKGKETLYFGVVGLVLALLGIAIFQTLLSLIITTK